MPAGRPPASVSFNCPNCQSLYQVIKVEAGPETNDRELSCRSCGAPLPSREDEFVLKYFLLQRAGRARRRA
jgi:transcription elongation factor Elf1